MKKPDRLAGFVEFEKISFPFEFDEDAFLLRLYPSSVEEWERRSSPSYFFHNLDRFDSKEHKWVECIELHGKTHTRNNVLFFVGSDFGNDNGFISFDVKWYYYYADGLTESNIGCFRVSGRDVDYFHWPSRAMNTTMSFFEPGRQLQKLDIDLKDHNILDCGTYALDENTMVHMEAESIVHYHFQASQPITADSIVTSIFSQNIDVHQLVNAIRNIQLFFQYVTYRKNIGIYDADVGFITDEGKQDYSGLFVMKKPQHNAEDEKKARERIIRSMLLGKHAGEILDLINQDKLIFRHICDCIDDRRHYTQARMIMVFTAFEREYANIYGQDTERSEDYLTVKAEIIQLIDEYRNRQTTSKRRTHAKDIRNYVDSRDRSSGANMKYAFNDCKDILIPFIRHNYKGEYVEVVSDISERMHLLRNGLVHSRLDIELEAIHLADIKSMEELLYAMRFKALEMDVSKIQCAINELFKENLAISG